MNNYYEYRKWLEGFIPYTYSKSNLGLERIRYLLKLLGNPQDKFKSIHVAGTSGKGSTAYYIAKLLQNAISYSPLAIRYERRKAKGERRKIGLHLSPHLVDIRERMQINGKLIESTEFIKLIGKIRLVVESIKREKPKFTPSYFEILVAASFKYFADEKVDWAVVEVGLGGRLDATNVLKPEISVITNVGLDHTEILGMTIEKIAFEKAGIIKRGMPVVTAAEEKALEIIEKVAVEKKAPLIKVNTQLGVKPLKSDIQGYLKDYYELLNSSGQSLASQNLKLALATVLSLKIRPAKQIVKKVQAAVFPGRFEEIESQVILDGAHNPDKIKFLIRMIKETTDYRLQTSVVDSRQWSVVLLLAFKKGKDWKGMIDLLIKNLPVKKVIATKFYAVTDTGKFSAVEPNVIAEYVRRQGVSLTGVYSNSQEAVFEAINSHQSPDTSDQKLILVTGSLYLVGEAITIWRLPKF